MQIINLHTQTASNFVREKGINHSILNLLWSEPGIVPPTPRDPFGLLNLQTQHSEAQRLNPSPVQFRVTKLLSSERAKVTNIENAEIEVS